MLRKLWMPFLMLIVAFVMTGLATRLEACEFSVRADVPTADDEFAKEGPAGEENPPGFWIFDRPRHVGAMSSDRPGFSDSYSVVPRGYSHLEFGYSFYYDHENSTRTKHHVLGESSLRTGLVDNFELRVKWGGYSFTACSGSMCCSS